MISAAVFINNDCRFKCSWARFQDMTVQTGEWGTVCEYIGSVHRDTIISNLLQKVTTQNRANFKRLIHP